MARGDVHNLVPDGTYPVFSPSSAAYVPPFRIKQFLDYYFFDGPNPLSTTLYMAVLYEYKEDEGPEGWFVEGGVDWWERVAVTFEDLGWTRSSEWLGRYDGDVPGTYKYTRTFANNAQVELGKAGFSWPGYWNSSQNERTLLTSTTWLAFYDHATDGDLVFALNLGDNVLFNDTDTYTLINSIDYPAGAAFVTDDVSFAVNQLEINIEDWGYQFLETELFAFLLGVPTSYTFTAGTGLWAGLLHDSMNETTGEDPTLHTFSSELEVSGYERIAVELEMLEGVEYITVQNAQDYEFFLSLGGRSKDYSITSASGDYDFATYPPTLSLDGTISDQWTATFTAADQVDISGSSTGAVGSFSTSSDIVVPNPNADNPSAYFILHASGFSGTFEIGDTIEFTTTPYVETHWWFISPNETPAAGDLFQFGEFDAVDSGYNSADVVIHPGHRVILPRGYFKLAQVKKPPAFLEIHIKKLIELSDDIGGY